MKNLCPIQQAIISAVERNETPLRDRGVLLIAIQLAAKSGKEDFRVIDAELQKMRKAGLIYATRAREAGWAVGSEADRTGGDWDVIDGQILSAIEQGKDPHLDRSMKQELKLAFPGKGEGSIVNLISRRLSFLSRSKKIKSSRKAACGWVIVACDQANQSSPNSP